MFDKFLICEDGFRHVISETGHVEGFEMKIRIPYYRGIPLSMVESITVKVQNLVFTNEHIRFTVAQGSFMMSEMETVGDKRWNLDEAATIKIYKPGGLINYDHPVELEIMIRTPYLRFPGRDRKVLLLQEDKRLCVAEGGGCKCL